MATYPLTCHACCGHGGEHAPWCKRPKPPAVESSLGAAAREPELRSCGSASCRAVFRGGGDLCPACRREELLALHAKHADRSPDSPETCHACHTAIYGAVSPEMEAAKTIVAAKENELRGMRDEWKRQRDQLVARADAAQRAHRGQIDLTMEEAKRADRAEALLHEALPMLADLVPKFPEAAELCAEIKAAIDTNSPTFQFVATT